MAKRKQPQGESEVLSDERPRRSTRQKINNASNVNLKTAQPKPAVKTKQEPIEAKDNKTVPKKENSKINKAAKKPSIPTTASSSEISGPLKTETPTGRQYWLMKAEPETRLENGHDVRFSIDDLAAKTEPEPWDGIRAYAARNNLRAMKKGDLAFFYHSNCKVPGIVGIMEIVAEHTPDLSAHDPSRPYHDPSSTPENPKWSVVHVSFRQKFETPITLREMKEWQKQDAHPLRDMQMLKLSRMSVSKVSVSEWEFLIAEFAKRGDVVTL